MASDFSIRHSSLKPHLIKGLDGTNGTNLVMKG